MKQLVIWPTLNDDQFPNWPIREVHLNSENEIKGVSPIFSILSDFDRAWVITTMLISEIQLV